MRVNNTNNQNFKALNNIKKPLGQFYNKNATIPTLIIETGVTLGRAYEANKRGGKVEAVDRLVEQGISAIVWIYGVKILKNIGDFIGKKVLKIDNLNFDVGFDDLRNPIKNNHLPKKMVGFKASNILISTAIATYFIGAILPKINNLILRKTLKEEELKKNQKQEKNKNFISFEKYKKDTKGKEISFTSLYEATVTSAHILENNAVARLFITDTGVVAGRYHNATNKYRKIEGLFRDIASIYFYLFSIPQMTKMFNKFSKNTDINPKALEKTVAMLKEKLKDNSISANDFEKEVLGKIDKDNISKVEELFKNKTIITVEEFLEKFPQLKQKAQDMAQLQPVFDNKLILSKMEAMDVISNSYSSNPKFLKDLNSYVTSTLSDDKFRFVSRKSLEATRKSIDNFINQIILKAKSTNSKINVDFIEKVANSNLKKNFIFNSTATLFSIFALGNLIPKIQYAITKKMTNENKFHTEED